MSYRIAILALVALQGFITTALPPCVCTRNLQPVCGSDGKTYGNECVFNCEKYKTGAEITIEKEGSCEAATTLCVCTFEYKPVCGTDGNTYPNRCALMCKRSSLPDINVASEGACDAVKVAEPPCICTDDLNEVCGSDGNTYANPCMLNCATAKDPTLSVKSHGKCDDRVRVVSLPTLPQGPQIPPCICTADLNEVCGSDGNTYANPCLLNCATAKDPTLSVKSHGKCADRVQVANLPSLPQGPQIPPCICTDDLNEVCGSDGKTYANPCLLNCATAKDPTLSVKSHGKCADGVQVANLPTLPQGPQVPPCICTADLNEVCGSDGKTYANPCLLNCATAKDPTLSVKSHGKCESVNVANSIQGDQPSSCSCPRNLKPVCGTDGVLYNNECLLRCAGQEISQARSGACRL